MPTDTNLISNEKKAAILLISLESELPGITTNIFSKIGEENSKKIIKSISDIGKIKQETVNNIISEFYGMAIERNTIFGGSSLTGKILKQSFGILEQKNYFSEKNIMFDFLKTIPNKEILNFFETENNQMVALICNFMNESRVAEIMNSLPPERTTDLSKLIVEIDPPNQRYLWRLQNNLIEKLITKSDETTQHEQQRIIKLARILEQVSLEIQTLVLDTFKTDREDLYTKINDHIFTFEDLMILPDKDLQTILYEVESLKTLARALKGTSESINQRIKANLSKRVNMILEEELESLPNDLSKEEEEKAKAQIVKIARKAEKDKKIQKLSSYKEA